MLLICGLTREAMRYLDEAIDQDPGAGRHYMVRSASPVTLTYDGRGNLTTSGTNSYTYTSENFLWGLTGGATLKYDPLGRLLETADRGTNGVTTRFSYDGDSLIAEYDGSNALLRRYVHGPGADAPLVWYEGTGLTNRRWLIPDERGSIIAVTDGAGAAIAVNSYDAYGIPALTNLGRFQYTGQTWIPELGMYNYKARIYSATLGRFMQTDPIGYGDGMNMYAYVANDPVNGTDPTGLVFKDIVVTYHRRDGSGGSSPSGDIVVTAQRFSGGGGNGIISIMFSGSPGFSGNRETGGGGGAVPETVGPPIVVTAKKAKPQSVADTAKKYAKKLGQCAADELGLTALGAGLAGAGANILDAGGKFSGATPGTSLASRAAGSILGDLQLPRALPTLTGFPGIGNGLRLSSTLSAARFAGRAVPVIGYAILAYDAYQIGKCVATGD